MSAETNSKFVETRENRPSISPEARGRIREFVKAVEALQKTFGVEICVDADTLNFRDTRRKDDWRGYGDWDAMIFNANAGYRMRRKNIRFEKFELWGGGL